MKNCYLFLTTGFEEIEAVATVDVLRRAELNVITVSVEESLLVKAAHNVTLSADTRFNDNDYSDAEILILPGGTLRLGEFERLTKLLVEQQKKGGKIAAICAAPAILGNLGILEGKTATCYPGFEQFLKKATVSSERVVKDGHIITGKGPGCTVDFALEIVKTICGAEKMKQVAEGLAMQNK
ncbi:MAG: DJ-1/PfpI family protein [Prevotellaceae bacterium]|jgi:4-methyl-5(b-hydroxyethyl)-thiazole monophosphate biosynthesis|nr:DJ-1/PfpI family protein [Prevotellaceae bacterium]